MAYDLYEQEKRVIAETKSRLEDGIFGDSEVAAHVSDLLKRYEKLFRETRRLVRMSDRSEAELTTLAKSLDQKNRMLETLSTKLSKYLAPQVYDEIFTGKRDVAIATERKKLTVFFSDIKDFTATTEHLEPEDLADLLNRYLTEMSNIALEHGATIDKYVGDAMLLFFGDPETKGVKEDATACVNMAIAMQRRMAELHEEWRQLGFEEPFRMRIGINTGYCNVGNFGSENRMDYTIIGGEVNLAARLEGIAEPDGVTLAYETYALVEDFVYALEGDPIHVKGISREVRPYAVVGIHDDLESSQRFIRKQTQGLQVLLDLEQMSESNRRTALEALDSVLLTLRGGKAGPGKAKRAAKRKAPKAKSNTKSKARSAAT